MNGAPTATYRLQFRNGMTFDGAVEILPYLRRLGVSHLYASPIFTAVGGSTHGYDVVDHNEFDPSLGGEAGFERLHAALQDAGMGLVLDIVPNHMAASVENRWWRSVIEFGAASPFARHFDIDWSRKLTLPILGQDYRDVLAAGELRVEADHKHGMLVLVYFDNRLPLNPESYRLIAEEAGDASATLDGFAQFDMRHGSVEAFHDAMRAGLAADNATHLDDLLATLSRDLGFIDRLHEAQSWRLTYWKDARRDLSYRRFFEVTGLVGVRVEEDEVFDDVHRLALSLVRSGKVDGLRVDHVDGLALPTSYLRRLRSEAGPETWILVEKILADGERLPAAWEGCGTTGYEFISAAAQLLVDTNGVAGLTQGYQTFASVPTDVDGALREAKQLILLRNFEGELERLATAAFELADQVDGLDRANLRDAIAEIILGFDVYRTYGESGPLSDQDELVLERAVDIALEGGRALPRAIAFIVALLLGDGDDDLSRGGAFAFRLRFQQLTGPIMAKAVEDTLFYRFNPLIALNEVGSSPELTALDVDSFHRSIGGLSGGRDLMATATHDTKRGEDARARLYALAEMPGDWSDAASRWSELNAKLKRSVGEHKVPEPDVEWLFYQALAGVWPAGMDPQDRRALDELAGRFLPYAEKALREAKLRTDWLDVDEHYERTVQDFVKGMLSVDNARFLGDFDATMRPLMIGGAINALSQTLAKLTAPGIPDIYQGAERLDLSLVDPDNRRAVDFASLAAALNPAADAPGGDEALLDGTFKQWMIARCLASRREHPGLFLEGDYQPLRVVGDLASHYPAFLRRIEDDFAIVILQRLPIRRAGQASSLGATHLELPVQCHGRRFRNVLTGEVFSGAPTLPLESVLKGLPVAMAVASAPY
ncbi:malto-oligosyltrehalose synthase [Mesorhizobium sp. CAU 1741]|uniref:malto-oligosyltrehalose synthase n=1 Tax=Mesorhizobium sp. CAU 1741 TaxID=3140366 RepID=UPI00325AC379